MSQPPAKRAKLAQASAKPPNGLKALVNGTLPQRLTANINGVRNARKDRVDDATAVVSGGGDVDMGGEEKEVIEISSADEESEHVSDEEEEEEEDAQSGAKEVETAPDVNGHVEDEDQLIDDDTADPEELSFGDRLRVQQEDTAQREPQIVHVDAAFDHPSAESKSLAAAPQAHPLSIPSSSSLGTVLAQALRTNDQALLDTCLRVVDIDSIYATVERLPSTLVVNLLEKLAERMSKKPGRAHTQMIWIQWSLAAHGGYLASQPQLVKKLHTLNTVLRQRAQGLQPLLSLKGRLDMLQAQLELRKRNQRKAANDDEDEAIIYVEGEDDYVSSAEGSVDGDALATTHKRVREDMDDDDNDGDGDESSVDEMPTTMEVDEASEDGSEDSEGLIDDEAEETDDDIGDEMSEPTSDDLDDGEGISDSEEEAKPARRSTAARSGLKSRH
jgi:U3 small nucleolar RNA-associated protein 5